MKIFGIDYSFKRDKELPEGALEDEFDEEDLMEIVSTTIHVGAENFFDATAIATEILNSYFEYEDDYEIRSVKEIYGVYVINWGMEDGDCDCPYCRAERMADEDLMHFECPKCHKPIRVADGDWDDIECKECGAPIQRDRIIDIGRGRYKVIEIKG